MEENRNKPYIIETEDDSLLEATNVSLKKDQLKALAVKLFGENAALSLWSYPEVDRVCLGDVPDTITIDGIEIKDGELKLLSDDLGGEIEQSALFWDQVEAISTMLNEVHAAYEKAHKEGETEDKRPLIKVTFDEDLSKSRGRDYYLGDNGRYFTRQPEGALRYDGNGQVIKDDWKWVICTDNYYLEPDYGYDKYARFEIVDSRTFAEEQDRLQKLADAKAKLFATILDAKKDLGDEISIAPTKISENGDKNVITEILADFESPFEDQNIIGGVSHSGDEDCVHNLALCLENVNDAEALGKAVHEAHVKHLEQDAKQVIHDRIVTPSARVFTPEQVGVLNRYHQVATPDTPASEAFSHLLDEVAQEPDVARKSEKWVADTANELDGIAEGITRDQGQGLRR